MEKNETPQPITREEFEAGVKFYYCNYNGDFYQFEKIGDHVMLIINKHDNCYASVQTIDSYGFNFIQFIFGVRAQGKILFKNCFKLPNQ